MRDYILYNPQAGDGRCREEAEILQTAYRDAVLVNMGRIRRYADFFDSLEPHDRVTVCGGDGTLHCFANAIRGLAISQPLFYYPVGSGNDFARDLGLRCGEPPRVDVGSYLTQLPTVKVGGVSRCVLNGVGYGIDGYCCEIGERIRADYRKRGIHQPLSYVKIAIRGVLGDYQPTGATVTVDGVVHRFEQVWLAPVMNGRYYGGGMMPAPSQQRLGAERMVTVMVMHGAGRLKTLTMFPSIFSGKHTKYRRHVWSLSGREITVTFDQPRPLQIDGEVLPAVSTYTVHTSKEVETVC